MFGTQHLLVFILAGISLNLVPGQDTLYIIGRSVAQGRTAGVVSVLGIGTGCLFHILAASLGLYAVLALWPLAFTAICLAGGVYLVYLGIMAVYKKGSILKPVQPGSGRDGLWLVYRQGLLTNLLNPKVVLFFIAFLPQFVDPVANYGAFSFLLLGFLFFSTGTIWCMIVALFASGIADALRTNPKIQRLFEYFSCILFAGLGAHVLVSALWPGL